MEDQKKQSEIVRKVIARAWADPEFLEKLMKNPKLHLSEAGIEIGPDREVVIVEEHPGLPDTDSIVYFVLPPRPRNNEMTEQQITKLMVGDQMVKTACCDITIAPRLFD